METYFLDTCVLYAYVNEADRFHQKAWSMFERILKKGDRLIISQYVLFEFVLLSIKNAAEDYFEENPDVPVLPETEFNSILNKIEIQRDLLTTLEGFEVHETVIPNNSSSMIEKLISSLEITNKTIKNGTMLYTTKFMGLLDFIHLICCQINNCDYFLTYDRDFNNRKLKGVFKTFKIIIM